MVAITRYLISFSLIIILLSCASYSPIFDKNKKFLDVGKNIANQDFESCKKDAEDYLKEYKIKKVANEARRKALVGGLWGLVFGNSTQSIIRGAVSGSIFGALYGGISSLGEDKISPDETKKRFITRCLNQKDYEIIGWY
jgi:hypothetical protein